MRSHLSYLCPPQRASTPSTAAKRPPARPVRRRPSAVMRPKLFCPISRELSYISRTCAHTCQPLPSAAAARPVPARRGHARGLRQPPRLPSCAQKFLPNLTHSLVISRLTLLHLCLPLTLQSIGQRGDSYRLPAAKIPLRFARFSCTKTAICAAAVNHPHHIIT